MVNYVGARWGERKEGSGHFRGDHISSEGQNILPQTRVRVQIDPQE